MMKSMNSLEFFGYAIEVGDLLTTLGTVVTAALALLAVFINHSLSSKRLHRELEGQKEQVQLDIDSREKEERLKQYLYQMERIFSHIIELRFVVDAIRKEFHVVDDEKSAKQFSSLLSKYQQQLELIDHKIRVLCSVYLDGIQIDEMFISEFQLQLVQAEGDLIFATIDGVSETKEEQQEQFERAVESFNEIISKFENQIWSFDRTLVEDIDARRNA
ncbi:hypothetical protein ACU5EH_05395 [Aliivibrio salmonicida]|uniref:hypothetical protein n=1 Tax=Aliivibrio salmonicida TaxID=40269 RepID=UPI00406CE052